MNWTEKIVSSNPRRFNLRPNVKKVVIGIIIGILGLIFLSTILYQVGTDEVGVITRFGKYIATTQPGLHVKIPYGVDRVAKVPVKRVQKEEFGFVTAKPGVRTEYIKGLAIEESLMLTGDLNSAIVEWIVQYRIGNPVDYLFNVRNVTDIIRDASESVMRQVVGDRSVDEVIILSRREVALEAKEQLQNHSVMSLTTPAPTVRPPSRIANRSSFSIAIGVINSTVICTLSPGITISTPSPRLTTPVTSVVRK